MRVPKVLVLDPDGPLGEHVDEVTAGLRPRPTVVSANATNDIDNLVGDHGPFDVVVAGPEASSEPGLHQLRCIRDAAPSTKIILAFERWPTQGLRDTVRLGAFDILRLPVN